MQINKFDVLIHVHVHVHVHACIFLFHFPSLNYYYLFLSFIATWSPDREGSIRLVGGVGAGRLEVYRGGSWGSVCNSEWSVEDSRTACRDLGYSVEPNPITADYRSFGKGGGAVKVSRLACKGNESRFSDCTYSSDVNGCDHDDDIAVVCQGEI